MTEETFLQKFYRENLESFRTKTVHQLINDFNRQVGSRGWSGTRGAYLSALRTAFDEFSQMAGLVLDKNVFMDKSTSYKKKIKLKGNRIVAINSFNWRSILGK